MRHFAAPFRKSLEVMLWIAGTFSFFGAALPSELPVNEWTLLQRDSAGARRGSALRWAPEARVFVLWGFMNDDPELLQEQPLMRLPEYDVVAFDPDEGKWRSQFPFEWMDLWNKQMPLGYVPRTYSGITTGSERTVLRGPTLEKEGVPRPDLNIVFDQVTYHAPTGSLIYFTGGLTAAYDVRRRRWKDLTPKQSPPPVVGGALAYDALHDEVVLFGGGHVAQPGPNGRIQGYTGTWVYSFRDDTWRQASLPIQPPPRMNTRMVCDTKNQVLVLFGGDGQTHYLADTWLFDLKTHSWRTSKASVGPQARAGHFTVYDPETGWVIVGGGYNRKDLADMWAYDASSDRWMALKGDVPTGFYLSADLAPEKRLIVMATNTQKPGDTMSCNILYPVRTTYGYRIDKRTLLKPGVAGDPQSPLTKSEDIAPESPEGVASRRQDQKRRIDTLLVNEWVHLTDPGRQAPTRTWGSATFDSDRCQILYWGGGHCGYEGNDVEAYDIEAHTWRQLTKLAEYPERLWNHGVRLAGVTFTGGPWTEHGRRIYAYDPVSRKMVMARPIRLTTGYSPESLRQFPLASTSDYQARVDALVEPSSSYVRYATWVLDLETGTYELSGAAPEGLDTLLSTPLGVMGLNVNWPKRLNDAGYQLPWTSAQQPEDTALFLFDAKSRQWKRLGKSQPSPQNLYEQTSLTYDSNRSQVLLHGAGARRDELWSFALKEKRWRNLAPTVIAPKEGKAPTCRREAVFLPRQDLLLVYAASSRDPRTWTLWAYRPSRNTWEELAIAGEVPRRMGWNHALVYDARHDLILLVAGAGGDTGKAAVYALRFKEH